jgi:hypothetical protein
LEEAQVAFRASKNAIWHRPLYQMANRLAHLYYLADIYRKNAYLVFIASANAPDAKKGRYL